jgi:nickel-dependent lactate racemase
MIGRGSATGSLSEQDVRAITAEFVERDRLAGKRLLAIIPDQTRSGPIGLMFRTLYDVLADRARALDFLIALGTHPPLSEAAIERRLGLAAGERQAKYPKAGVFNHAWDNPAQLTTLGSIAPAQVAELSGGRMNAPVPVTINRAVLDYDVVLIVGPTFPHEVVGFSGGNKYLFPGIAGPEIINMFHWLGALVTSPAIIGRKWTPTRAVVEAAAQLVPTPRRCMSLVVRDDALAGLYCGLPEETWSAAADLSDKIHIVYKERPFRSVLSCAPAMYDEMWVGGKCAYKLEPVVADGGELIIYGPHITRISVTHGALIEQIGYHVRDYFLKQWVRFADVPGGVLAHSTHVKGLGTFESGVERPRATVTLATGIPEALCRKINLGYRDPRSINQDEWRDREAEGYLLVPKSGETLYRLHDDPFAPPSPSPSPGSPA